MRRRSGAAVLLLVSLLTPAAARAQEWTLDLYGGRATYPGVASNVGTHNAALGLRYLGASGWWASLSGAIPFLSQESLWAGGGLGHRFLRSLGQVEVGVDLSGFAHAYRDPILEASGSGATLEILPLVRLSDGPASVEFRSGWLRSMDRFDGEGSTRDVFDTGARFTYRARPALELGGEVRLARAREGGYPYLGASASYDFDRGQVWGSVGRWFSDEFEAPAWGVGASYPLGERMALWASVQQEASEPLYRTDARRSWNIGFSRQIGGGVEPAPPTPVAAVGGRVTIRLPLAEAAKAPAVAGDFNGWKPVRMVRSGEFWAARVAVRPGVYKYAFRSAEGVWFVPRSAPGRTDDGMGGYVAVLVVQ